MYCICVVTALLMMGSDQYCLKWNNHWANLIRVFNSLLQSETFVDVTLACEGRHLKAHRLVLSACSPYFKELLVAHPDKHPIVILKDVRYSELRTLIEFIYNGEVSVEQQDLAALLCTARELQIKGLADNRLPGAPHHQTSSKDPLGHLFTPTSIPGMPPTTHYSTSPPLDATIKGSSPRRKVGSEDRPPPPLTAIHSNISVSSTSTPCPSQLPTYRSRPSSRETSPAHKRLRRSPVGTEEDATATEATKDTQTEPPNGHLHPQQDHSESHYMRLAGPSGLRLITNSSREVRHSTHMHVCTVNFVFQVCWRGVDNVGYIYEVPIACMIIGLRSGGGRSILDLTNAHDCVGKCERELGEAKELVCLIKWIFMMM